MEHYWKQVCDEMSEKVWVEARLAAAAQTGRGVCCIVAESCGVASTQTERVDLRQACEGNYLLQVSIYIVSKLTLTNEQEM